MEASQAVKTLLGISSMTQLVKGVKRSKNKTKKLFVKTQGLDVQKESFKNGFCTSFLCLWVIYFIPDWIQHL